MPGIKAGVVLKTRFVDLHAPNSKQTKAFQSYIDYIDRDDAARSEGFQKFSLYNDYMDNPQKSNGLFTADQDCLTQEQKKQLKTVFQTAYDHDSIMWQTVISFDNRFLAEQGIYDPATHMVNEPQLHQATRNMMKDLLGKENMLNSAVWSASIHFNTDNIHIHVATVEPNPTRKKVMVDGKERSKGFFKPQTIKSMKSKVVNTLLEHDRTLIDELVRNRMVQGKRNTSSFEDRALRKMFKEIYTQLPPDRRMWNYNMNEIKQLRPLLDQMSQQYIHTYHRQDFADFQKLLIKDQQVLKQAYGENSSYKDYAQTKMNDLYTRMGNATLSEMRRFAREDQHQRSPKRFPLNSNHMNATIKRLKNNLSQTIDQEAINQREHQQLSYEIG